MERCPGYVGYTCVNGSCPRANADEYAERGYDITHSCDECGWYKGCEDCALEDTEHCVKNKSADEETCEDDYEYCEYNDSSCDHWYMGICDIDICNKCPHEIQSKSGKKHIKDSTELSGGHLW